MHKPCMYKCIVIVIIVYYYIQNADIILYCTLYVCTYIANFLFLRNSFEGDYIINKKNFKVYLQIDLNIKWEYK